MKTPIARAVSLSAARLRLVHVSVRNEGHELFQWHHNGLHEVAWRRGGYDKVALRSREVGLAEAESMGRRVRWGWAASSCRTDTRVAAPFTVGFVGVTGAQEGSQRATAS